MWSFFLMQKLRFRIETGSKDDCSKSRITVQSDLRFLNLCYNCKFQLSKSSTKHDWHLQCMYKCYKTQNQYHDQIPPTHASTTSHVVNFFYSTILKNLPFKSIPLTVPASTNYFNFPVSTADLIFVLSASSHVTVILPVY